MNFYYIHHAERDFSEGRSQKNKITKDGYKELYFLADRLKNVKDKLNIIKIYTSPFYRCKETADILAKALDVSIEIENGFKEKCPEINETLVEFHKRNINSLKKIYDLHHNKNENVMCVTSGINLTGFICYFYNIDPTEDIKLTQAVTISPIKFTKD